jgi:hypothetical protein
VRHTLSKGFVMAAAVTGALSLYSSEAHADSATEETAVETPDVLSDNTVQIPVHVQLDVCGNTINALAAETRAPLISCDNASSQSGIPILDGHPVRVGEPSIRRPAGKPQALPPKHGRHHTSHRPSSPVPPAGPTDKPRPTSPGSPSPGHDRHTATTRTSPPWHDRYTTRTTTPPPSLPSTPRVPTPAAPTPTPSLLGHGRHASTTTSSSVPPTTPTTPTPPPPAQPNSPTTSSLGHGRQTAASPLSAPLSPPSGANVMAGTGTEAVLAATAASVALLVGGVILYRRRRNSYRR